MKKALIWSAVLLGALSSGCGGGEGGEGSAVQSSPASPSAPPPNVEPEPAPAEPFNIPSTTLTASSGGNSYTAIYSETPNEGTTMFDGHEANSSTISLTITENGFPILTQIETAYYLEDPYQPLGSTLSYNGAQFDFRYNSTDPLPSTATVGSSGPLGSGTYYAVKTNDVIGSLTKTYSVTSGCPGCVIFLNISATGTVNGQPISETISYAVTVVVVASVEIQLNGMTLNFQDGCAGCWDY